VPAAALIVIAVLINAYQYETDRARRVADHVRLAAASVDLRLGQLLELASFCATSPALINRVDFGSVADNCGRYAYRIGAWVVLVETGDTYRQILNTRPDAPTVLPGYPRDNEHATLRALEERSRSSGEPGIADVFTGIILPEGIVSAGQYLRLADGRDAMLYVSIAARALSDQLAELAVPEGPIFALIDPSRRIVARSVGIERAMFAEAPDWILSFMETGTAGASLGVPGPDVIGGTWDAGYQPLEIAPGWMAAAFQPTPAGGLLWAPLSLPSAITLLGFLLSGLLLWVMADRDRAARRVADAERRNREKSRLLASFAHDIRSPLISLIGSLELNGEGREPPNGQLRSAHESAEALLQLVDDILELSFLGSGELTLHPSPVDLHQLARALSDQIQPLAARKGLDVRLDLDPGLPVTVEVDRLRLQQVLSNLLTNAVKYTERGSVTLRTRLEGIAAGRVTLDLAVIDTGIGLAPEDVPRILREFGRLEREAERRETGSGLGLAIVQRILHRMATALEVESAPGHGAAFHFRLTLPILTGRALLDVVRPLSSVTILYAEDEPVIRQVTMRRLEEAGACVLGAVDGEDALRQLANTTPDLLLIDLQMPGLDGVGLIRRLQEAAPERAYPIFVLTSHISGPQAAEARATGADAVFTKPIQVAALAAAFRARRGNEGHSTPRMGEVPNGADEPLLDAGTFEETISVMGSSEAASLVTEFEETMRAALAALQIAINADNMTQSSKVAHRALGLCLVMGAVSLTGRLRRIEEAAEAGDAEIARGLASRIDPILTSTLSEMLSALESPASHGV
jgi:signal transduction histidine kinase/CheY-like chemotaxis protein